MSRKMKNSYMVTVDDSNRPLDTPFRIKLDPVVLAKVTKEQMVIAANLRGPEKTNGHSLLIIKQGGQHIADKANHVRSVAQLITGVAYTHRKPNALPYDYRRTAFKKPKQKMPSVVAKRKSRAVKPVTSVVKHIVDTVANLTIETKHGNKISGLNVAQVKELLFSK